MKIKREIGLALLFAINAGVIIAAICNNILKHHWIEVSTNAIMLLTCVYFIAYFLDHVFNNTTRRANCLSELVQISISSTENMLDWSKELVKKLTSREELKLNIVCENEKYLPAYANDTDACMDLKIKVEDPDCYFLKPNETVTFSTGIKASIPEDYMMLVFPRSSTGFKLNCTLTNTTGIIDAGYRDDIKISLYNFGKETVCLKDAQRIAQFIVIPRPKLELNLVEDDEVFRNGDRGGGIGSTGE